MDRTSAWINPFGYQRTSEELQFKYLKILLERGRPNGTVLDVGCGIGNSLRLLGYFGEFKYTGVDVSPEMLNFASAQPHKTARFVCGDFLDPSLLLETEYDHVICAACLHWFHPRQKEVIQKIKSILRVGGSLHLSTALSFTFLSEQENMQREAIDKVRSKFPPTSPTQLFRSRRLSPTQIKEICDEFDIVKVSLHEENLEFTSIDDFIDWHTGSGSVLAMQFSQQDLGAAEDMYYRLLYDWYLAGQYQVAYGTALLNLIRNR